MTECSRCGICCTFLNLGRVQNMTAVQKEYARLRGAIEDQGYFLVPFECPNLIRPSEDDIVNGDTKTSCRIHETKPKICKDFDGRHYNNHTLYWVPKECSLLKREKTLGDGAKHGKSGKDTVLV